jgi:hypothetical protein
MLNGPCTRPVLSYSAKPPKSPKEPPNLIFSPQNFHEPSSPHAKLVAAPRPLSPYSCLLYLSWPFKKVVDLLLLALRLQVLVGAERQRAADQDDGVQADACRGAVGGRGGGAGLCVALGLGVALLVSDVSACFLSVFKNKL